MDNDFINLVEIMPDMEEFDELTPPIIKVLGVGGGGSNAAKHMYNRGIVGVDFIICNTDRQALESNPIPVKIQLGDTGLGAGAKPDVAREAAVESEERIKAALEDTKMVFVTAGMGGGTGTGASPIVASIAKEMGILTVGIVTYPFDFEQESKQKLADDGINELGSNVDALIVIKNEALNSYYPDLELDNAFAKVDDVLLIAAKSIAELITVGYSINVDFNDVDTVLRNSGTAIIGSGEAEGENRAVEAAEAAVKSPLLDTNSVYGAGKVLFFVSYGSVNKLKVRELNAVTEVLANETCNMKETFIWGQGIDESLGEKVRVTVIATHLQPRAPKISRKSQFNTESGDWTDEQQKESSKNSEGTKRTDRSSLFPPMVDNVEQKPPVAEHTPRQPATKTDRPLDNNELRSLTDEQMRSLLETPAYQRNKVMQEHKNNEISNFHVRSNGMVEHQPIYLKDKAD